MTENNRRMSIGFYVSDDEGHSYKTNVTESLFPEVGYTEWECFVTQLNNFLRTWGYGGVMFNHLLDEDEVDFLEELLSTYREERLNSEG